MKEVGALVALYSTYSTDSSTFYFLLVSGAVERIQVFSTGTGERRDSRNDVGLFYDINAAICKKEDGNFLD